MRFDLRALPWFAAALGASLALAAVVAPIDLNAWWAGEVDLTGHRRFDAPTPRVADISAIDFALVHGELWPAWVAASPEEEPQAYANLREAVSPDPYLTERVERTRALARQDAFRNAGRLLYQVWAWNRYCDLAAVPWRLTAGIYAQDPRNAMFYVKSYRVISDTPTRVGGGHWRTRIVQRVDDLNLVEGYLGLTSDHEEGAVVVAERVAAFALERVWPLLDEELDPERTAMDAAFAPAIRAEVRRALHPTDYRVLSETAADRFWLERAIAAVHTRARCGSEFEILELPYDGLHARTLREVQRRQQSAAAADPCPDVTQMEFLALKTRSKALQSTAGLEQALEALNAHVARTIAVHEARHAADDAVPGPLSCPGCGLSEVGILEASAYLASFRDPETSTVALLQACAVAQVNAAGRAKAIEFVTDALGDPCTNGPTSAIPELARKLESELFDRDDAIALHPEFPMHLPLERAIRAGLPQQNDVDVEDGLAPG